MRRDRVDPPSTPVEPCVIHLHLQLFIPAVDEIFAQPRQFLAPIFRGCRGRRIVHRFHSIIQTTWMLLMTSITPGADQAVAAATWRSWVERTVPLRRTVPLSTSTS